MNRTRTKEYDAFGPWVFEIDEHHGMPQLFSGYAHLQERAVMMFKVPRKIERRNANPNMHLYDAVVGLFGTHLLLLSRYKNSVHERRVEYNDIQAIKNVQCLLLGELHLYTNKNVIKINYNTVSENIISRAIAAIRDLQNNRTSSLKLSPMSYDFRTIDHLYVNLLKRIERDDVNAQLVAYQPAITLPKKGRFLNSVVRFFNVAPSLQCTAFVSNDRDVIIISRTTAIKSPKEVSYSYSYTFIPIARIKSVARESFDKESTLLKLALHTKSHNFEVLYNQSNTGIKQLYDKLR